MAKDGRSLLDANAFLWNHNARLREENQGLRSELKAMKIKQASTIGQLQQTQDELQKARCQLQELQQEKALLDQRLADLTAKAAPKPTPVFIKPNTPHKRRKKPGRPAGHPAALRPLPASIDVHQQVPLPIDLQGKACCPHCRTQLSDVEKHDRLVEDLLPAQTLTTCYHTLSGYCPSCRKHVESRAPEQPPAADLPHGQLGLNALATAAVMRLCYRMPMRQISRFFMQLPGLRVCPGAIARQLQRLGGWLEGQYDRLKLALRAAGVVHADETGWRTDGQNGYLWTLTNDRHTLFHVDRSRSGKVIAELLGEGFAAGGGTLVSDFYSAYDRLGGCQQKCLVHLLRELRETVARRPDLKGHFFFRRCKRLIQDMLKLKRQRQKLTAEQYRHQVELAEARLAELAQSTWSDADAQRLTARLAKYRVKLTTFLHREEVEGTNNAAERAIRPAVVMRKITGGSRSEAGAEAWSILASVMRTAEQQGRDVVETIKTLLKAQWAGQDLPLLTAGL
jgi:transposase